MKKLLLATTMALVLIGCNDAKVSSLKDTTTPALTTPPSITSVEKQLPKWINDNKVTAPLEAIVDGGHTYQAVSYCKPHDCASNFMITLTDENNKQYSMIVFVKDVPDALNTPSIYATYQYIGDPSAQVKQVFNKALSQNPNWQ